MSVRATALQQGNEARVAYELRYDLTRQEGGKRDSYRLPVEFECDQEDPGLFLPSVIHLVALSSTRSLNAVGVLPLLDSLGFPWIASQLTLAAGRFSVHSFLGFTHKRFNDQLEVRLESTQESTIRR